MKTKTYTKLDKPKEEVFLDYTQHKPYFHIKFERYNRMLNSTFKVGKTEITGHVYYPQYAIHLSWFKFNKTFFLNENEMLNTGEVAKKVV